MASAAALTSAASRSRLRDLQGRRGAALASRSDLLTPLGLPVAVVPHYDNAEAATTHALLLHGRAAAARLEAELPDEVFILASTAHCPGHRPGRRIASVLAGTVTVRKDGRSKVYPAGSEASIAELVAAATAGGDAAPVQPPAAAGASAEASSSRHCAKRWPTWSASSRPRSKSATRCGGAGHPRAGGDDPGLVSRHRSIGRAGQARSALRAAVVCLGEMAVAGRGIDGGSAPVRRCPPGRASARSRGPRLGAADAVRDRLLAAGVELHDTPDGTSWELHPAAP